MMKRTSSISSLFPVFTDQPADLMLAYRGRMEIESRLGRGTTVYPYFPVWRG
ncbi:MAG TPA: hypothetical protein PLR20_12580 [Syntrophales bacterium]|nr:hypothetical protein [Syntrophales bacterium]HOX95408.1 hypothetical protein [Syntrophales bacterium]HPI58131.1 hypothetical protein [Syntrophales bacterium]HPN26236.1 hypothetical protein [Syntrophales bacterium]HQM30179.1 hypothetical protein [Syntrophales bacterium]